MIPVRVTEKSNISAVEDDHRSVLMRFDRSKILEVYFARIEGRSIDDFPREYHDLLNLDLHHIKEFLLGQHPQDPLLQKIFRLMA